MSDKTELELWGDRESIGQKNWLLAAVAARPGSTLKQLADTANMDRNIVNQIMQRLENMQLVKAVNSGTDSYYYPSTKPSYPSRITPCSTMPAEH